LARSARLSFFKRGSTTLYGPSTPLGRFTRLPVVPPFLARINTGAFLLTSAFLYSLQEKNQH
jgi:hypothetical protein